MLTNQAGVKTYKGQLYTIGPHFLYNLNLIYAKIENNLKANVSILPSEQYHNNELKFQLYEH